MMLQATLLAMQFLMSPQNDAEKTIDAWSEFGFTTAGVKAPVMAEYFVINLAGEGYQKSYYTGQCGGLFWSRKLTFSEMPTGKSLKFTIYLDEKLKHNSVFKVHQTEHTESLIKNCRIYRFVLDEVK